MDFKIISAGGGTSTQLPTSDILVYNTSTSAYANPANTTGISAQGTSPNFRLYFTYTGTVTDEIEIEATLSSTNYTELNGKKFNFCISNQSDFQADLTNTNTRLTNLQNSITEVETKVDDVKGVVDNNNAILSDDSDASNC